MPDLTKKSKPIAILNSKAKPRIRLRGKDVVVHGEKAETFDALHADVMAALKPQGMIERIWTQDISYHQWTILRYRRLIARLLSLGRRPAMMRILFNIDEPLNDGYRYNEDKNKITDDWMEGDEETVQEIDTMLERDGGGKDAVIAQALAMNLGTFECIDRLMAAAELRRDRILRDHDRRRADMGAPLARTVDQPKHVARDPTMDKK